MMRRIAWGSFATALLAGGCAGRQSVLDPAGLQAQRLDRLWWLYFDVCAAMYVLVLVAVIAALLVYRQGGRTPVPHPAERFDARFERRLTWVVVPMIVVATVLLAGLLAAEYRTRGVMHSLTKRQAMTVTVTGHQWWWEFEYQDSIPANNVNSPNELHLPIGVDVLLDLRSNDVIHSLWIPNLLGKRDLVPGHPTQTYVRADRAGTYYGQCAEFCGFQHATMRMTVIVEPMDRFRSWLEAQRSPAVEPATPSEQRGRQVFLSSTCIMCHTIQGTTAQSRMGPDLTHVGGRQEIAAATMTNRKDHMMQWIENPQSVRPGVRMPPNPTVDLGALADYLESLK
jgi:cytochrome c oxidase subunit 2